MGREQIVLRIDPDGAIRAETKGMKGTKCLDSIEILERLLDARTTSSAFTPEYSETSVMAESEVNDELRH